MKTKQTTEREQQGMETEQTVKSDENVSTGKPKILKRVWTFCFQHPIAAATCVGVVLAGVGTLLLGIAAIRPNSLDVNLNSEDIVKIIQALKSEESSRLEESLQNIEDNPKASGVDRDIAEAYRLQLAGKIDAAIEKWRSIANVVEETNSDLAAGAWFLVGYLHSMEGEEERALFAYDKAIGLKSDFTEVYTNRGIAKNALGKYEEAIADHDIAINLKPNFVEAYINRGAAKSDLGKYKKAIADFDIAIQLKPDLAEAYTNRGAAKNALGRHKEAIANHDVAIRLRPNLAEAYANRGAAKDALGKHEEAIIDYNKAIHLRPDLAEVYSNRGIAKANLGMYNLAISDYNAALRQEPGSAEAYNHRGSAKKGTW